MPIRLNDEHCLLWIKDPSVSPFDNNKNILTEDTLKNPRSFLNRIRRKCFHNSTLRPKIVEQIKEYQRNVPLRLHILDDKKKSTIKYTNEPFSQEECMRWIKNNLINPRTNEKIISYYDELHKKKLNINKTVYIELVYTTLQYGLSVPSILDTVPKDKNENITKKRATLHKYIENIIENVMFRLDFIKQNDEYFLKHDVVSFDKKLKIASSLTPIRKAARQAAKPKNSFDVSLSSSNKSLNLAERRQLRDMELENKEEKKLVAEYQYKKGFLPKKDGDKIVFRSFRAFLNALNNEVLYGTKLINNILKNISSEEINKLIDIIKKHYIDGDINEEMMLATLEDEDNYDDPDNNITYDIDYFLKLNHLDNIKDIITSFINYIYVQLLNPSIELPNIIKRDIVILSYYNQLFYFNKNKITDRITNRLFKFNMNYSPKLDGKVIKYFRNLVEDRIPSNYVEKRIIDKRERVKGYATIRNINDYANNYYKFLHYERSDDGYSLFSLNMRLPEGKGLLIGKELTKYMVELKDAYDVPESYSFDKYFEIEADYVVITDDNPLNGFTYKECEDWVILPIINPRTFKPIKIDSPIYNRLLCMSYQYDCFLIPRMLTSRGMTILLALRDIIQEILSKEEKSSQTAQTKEQLEKYIVDKEKEAQDKKRKKPDIIGLIWKDIGGKKPTNRIDITAGHEALVIAITNKVLRQRIATNSSQDPVAFYAIFTKNEWETLNITNLEKNIFIKIKKHYYIPVVEKRASDIYIKPKTNTKIAIKRNQEYIVKKYYTVADCLRWANQPNRDPKNPDIFFSIDSKEYNIIFEQAILYYYNIMPINITSKGIKFREAILDKDRFSAITKVNFNNVSSTSSLDITNINSIMCNAIQNIYDNETDEEGRKYKKFKDKMIEKCKKFNKEPGMCIKKLKKEINMLKMLVRVRKQEYEFKYYQDSALASLLIYYEGIKNKIYNDEFRNIFIHDFTKFYVYIYELDDNLNERKKDAIDAGGPKREFFTKLFEELFCDDEHTTRPFISPNDIIGNIYCINPNFAPDENFRKVIGAYKKNHSFKSNFIKNKHTSISNFDTEGDYEYIYFVIGKLLCLTVVNEVIGLPQQLSSYILAGLINQKNELNYYDILYFYLREFNTAISYISMISEEYIKSIDDVNLSFNNTYIISKLKNPYSVNKYVEPPIPIKAQLPINLLRYKMLSTTKDAVKNSSNERKLREYDEKWKEQLKEYEMKKDIYDRAGASLKSSGENITKKNFIKFILQQSRHVITKNFLGKFEVNSGKNMKKRYDSLFAGFSNDIRKFLYKKKVTIEQLSLLITNETLTIEILQELVSKIDVYMEIKYTPNSFVGIYTGAIMTDAEKKRRGDELKGYMSNIITNKRKSETKEEHIKFVKKLLRFWSGLTYYDKTKPYRICYKYGVGININKLPCSHTCFYTLDIYGFHENYTPEEREEFIYGKFKLAVGEQEMELH